MPLDEILGAYISQDAISFLTLNIQLRLLAHISPNCKLNYMII
jgi:hypothetical protein